MRIQEVVFDCTDSAGLAGFWGALLDRPWGHRSDLGGVVDAGGLYLLFQVVPEPKGSPKNRLHLDVEVDELRSGVARAEALGATRVGEFHDDPAGGGYVVLRDPEANEFCLVAQSEGSWSRLLGAVVSGNADAEDAVAVGDGARGAEALESFEVQTTTGATAVLKYADLAADGEETGPPVVFVHGLGCASTLEYAEVAARPGLAGRRRILVDLVGSGHSGRPQDFDYTVEGQARCLDSFLTALGLERVVLYGHSMGGSIALSLAALDPGRVAGLVLSESNLDAGGGTESRAIAAQDADSFARVGWPALLDAVRADGVPWIRTAPLSAPEAVHAEATSLVAGVTPSWREILYGLDAPRFYLFGSRTLPDPDFEELPRHGVTALVVPEAGHNMA